MKKLAIISILFYFTQTSFAQKSAVVNLYENIIYNGTSTPIQVMLPICNYDSVSVTTSHGDISKTMNGYYAWRVCVQTESERSWVILKVFIKAFQNGQLIYEDDAEFRLKYAPNPKPRIINNRSHSASMFNNIRISECFAIGAILTDFHYESFCKVKHYKVIHIRDGELFKEWRNEGEMFEKHTRENLEQVKKGDTIIFSDITARCNCDGFTRNLGELTFEVNQ